MGIVKKSVIESAVMYKIVCVKVLCATSEGKTGTNWGQTVNRTKVWILHKKML